MINGISSLLRVSRRTDRTAKNDEQINFNATNDMNHTNIHISSLSSQH